MATIIGLGLIFSAFIGLGISGIILGMRQPNAIEKIFNIFFGVLLIGGPLVMIGMLTTV